ncbi:hypothetical protein AHF37_07878, partial [Paragonimus kellicotti]
CCYIRLLTVDTQTFRGTKLESNLKVQTALQQLLVPYILDDSVEKVIVLNPNLLFNENIEELWKHFNRFTQKQAIGAVCEQAEECPDCCPRGQQTFPLYGINAGLMLLHLSKLRRTNWRHLFKTEFYEEQYLREEPGDLNQGILNLVLSKRVPMLYQLPCEWNVQAKNSEERMTSRLKMMKKENKLQPIKLGPLRYKFHMNYGYFQQLPLKCFVNQKQQTPPIGPN